MSRYLRCRCTSACTCTRHAEVNFHVTMFVIDEHGVKCRCTPVLLHTGASMCLRQATHTRFSHHGSHPRQPRYTGKVWIGTRSGIEPVNILKVVVFPAPLIPKRPKHSPLGTPSHIGRTAYTGGCHTPWLYVFFTPSSSTWNAPGSAPPPDDSTSRLVRTGKISTHRQD